MGEFTPVAREALLVGVEVLAGELLVHVLAVVTVAALDGQVVLAHLHAINRRWI